MNDESEKQITNNQLCLNLLRAIKTEANLTKHLNIKKNLRCYKGNEQIENLENKYNKLELRYINLKRECRKNIIILGLKVHAENDILK